MKKKYLSIKRFYYKVSIYILGFSFLVLSGCKWKKQLDDDSNTNIKSDSSIISTTDTNTLMPDTQDVKDVPKVSKKPVVKHITEPPVVAEYGVRQTDYINIDAQTDEKQAQKDTTKKTTKPDPMLPVTAYGTYPDGYKTLTIDKNQNKPTE